MFVCLFVYCVLWIVYATPLRSRQIFSCLALVFILLLVWLAWVMFRATFEELPDNTESLIADRIDLNIWKPWTVNWRKCLKVDVSKEQPFALLFFFMVFLSIAYLFAFAFAFHDKSRPSEPALYMRDLTANTSPSPTAPLKTSYQFKFNKGSAVIEEEEIDPEFFESLRDLAALKSENAKILEDIAKYIVTATEKGYRAQVTLTGHADETPINGSAYQSNYELAEARAKNAQGSILKKIIEIGKGSWKNVEWLCLSNSNEPEPRPIKEKIPREKNRPSTERGSKPARTTNNSNNPTMRVVEVSVEPISHDPTAMLLQQVQAGEQSRAYKALNLMDYVYFSIYTVTTTGYGDIMPTTSYAKFLISIANILEVFFLVVFFNALLSVRIEKSRVQRSPDKDEEKENGPPDASQAGGSAKNHTQRPRRPPYQID